MADETGTQRSGAAKGAYGALGAIGAYVGAPLVVAIGLGGVPPQSPIAKVIDAIYPRQVGDRLIETPPVAVAPPAQNPVPAAQAPKTPVAAPPAAAPADASIAMISTPAAAPLKARIEPPALKYESGNDVAFAMTLVSGIDALPAFMMQGSGYLEGWSATVKPSNATCKIYASTVTGLSSYRSDQEWRDAADDISKLGKDVGVTVSGVISCSEKVRAGDTITIAARIHYLSNGARTPVSLYSPPMTVVAHP